MTPISILGHAVLGHAVLGEGPEEASGTIAIGAGSLVFTGFAPAVLQNTIAIPDGSLTLNGFAPTVALRLPIGTGSLTLTGFAPNASAGINIGAGALTLTGFAPTVTLQTNWYILDDEQEEPEGEPVFVGGTTAGTFPRYTVYIDGVDRNAYRKPGIQISQQVGSRATASFKIQDLTGAYRPEKREEVIILRDGSLKMFAGYIERITLNAFVPSYSGNPGKVFDVTCTDYGVLGDRRFVGRYYTEFMGGMLGIIVGDALLSFMQGTGLTLAWNTTVQTFIGAKLFYYPSFTEMCNQLAQLANCDWRVDWNKVIRFFTKTDGYASAPYSFTDVSANWVWMKVSYTQSMFANRIIAKSSRNLGSVRTDTVVGDGNTHIAATTYHMDVKPSVLLNGVPQTVVEIAAIGTASYDFYFIQYNRGVFRNQTFPPLAITDTVEISYPSPLPYVGIAEDAASIAAKGLYERTVEAGDIDNRDQLDAIAAAELLRSKQDPIDLEIQTLTDGFEAGQRVTVNVTHPDTINDTFLIESVNSQEEALHQMRHSIKATNGAMQRTGAPNKTQGYIYEKLREKPSRIVQRLKIILAGTIEGLTNPGLSVGVKEEVIGEILQDGVLGEVRMHFGSVENGTPTTQNIEIDLFINGVTIFDPADRPVYPAGSDAPIVHWTFVTEPFPVRKHDLLTRLQIISADAAAMDGYAELVVFS